MFERSREVRNHLDLCHLRGRLLTAITPHVLELHYSIITALCYKQLSCICIYDPGKLMERWYKNSTHWRRMKLTLADIANFEILWHTADWKCRRFFVKFVWLSMASTHLCVLSDVIENSPQIWRYFKWFVYLSGLLAPSSPSHERLPVTRRLKPSYYSVLHSEPILWYIWREFKKNQPKCRWLSAIL